MGERVGAHERRGKRERGLPYCLTHDCPSPFSFTYCDIEVVKRVHFVDACVIRRNV